MNYVENAPNKGIPLAGRENHRSLSLTVLWSWVLTDSGRCTRLMNLLLLTGRGLEPGHGRTCTVS